MTPGGLPARENPYREGRVLRRVSTPKSAGSLWGIDILPPEHEASLIQPALFMKGLKDAFPGFVLGAKKATRGLREGRSSLKGSFSDKHASRDCFRVDFGRTYPPGLSRSPGGRGG
jgi:hypothetical protein